MIHFIAEAQGLWYEGSQSWLQRIQGHPIILPFAVLGKPVGQELLFLEDYFNSATRIRRGRLFEKDMRNSWPADVVSRFPNRDLHNNVNRFDVNRSYKTADFQIGVGDEVELGDNGARSRWIVVLSEKAGLEGYYVTLKSKTFFGVLPELLPDQIPESNRHDVLGSMDAVVDAASIQAPQSVIDACRNAACHLISAKFPASNPGGKQDLGKLVGWLAKNERESCGSAGNLINSLHSRAKANAAASRGTRPVSRRDAELAVNSLAFLLQDFGWGKE
ncbi:hypothetical protein PY254_01560 [Rhodanobacter sp. AS-Z3]|uniref:hypothetical protein n=1 Tax=Rhodanobacter sp. AS-Z3 TaxID=3031330 RepID=UPI00247A3C61|nr:hypothetical protein [Rhodanobacter sp. AS-Z3]WEN15395.1 hypothetical protein PY254_01560 [Rhodanobacter sp. AS-Z3]